MTHNEWTQAFAFAQDSDDSARAFRAAREGMVSAQDVLDGCGCTGGTCWCIQHVVANLRGEEVVENPEPMVSVKRVRDAVRKVMSERNLLGEDAVFTAIDASGTEACKAPEGDDGIPIHICPKCRISFENCDCTGEAGEG